MAVNNGLSSNYEGLFIENGTLLTLSLNEVKPFLHGDALDIGSESCLKPGQLTDGHDYLLKIIKEDEVTSIFGGMDGCLK